MGVGRHHRAQLDANKVKDARKDEIGYIRKHGVYRKVRRDSVPKGAKIIQVRWIDINKGDEVNVDIRSRLVAKEFKTDLIYSRQHHQRNR